MDILNEIRRRFESAIAALPADPTPYLDMVRPAQNAQFGDYQANCAMPLAGRLKRDSTEIAQEIIDQLEVSEFCEPPTIAGKGFINLKLRDDWLSEQTANLLADDRLGVSKAEPARTIVIDYSAPNIAKPMHVGHLRSTVIGAALYRILGFQGHKVIGDNHVGDWGTQFGMILYGYKNFLDAQAYAAAPVAELARLYRLVNQLSTYHKTKAELPQLQERITEKQDDLSAAETTASGGDKKAKQKAKALRTEVANLTEKITDGNAAVAAVDDDDHLNKLAADHPSIAVDARKETAKLHAGDEENNRLWNEFLPACLDALTAVYDRMGVTFDSTLGESYYNPMLAGVVDDLLQKGIAEESEGAICVFQKGNAAPFIIRKADGAFTYGTTDLATIAYRLKELHADTILYVVDSRQAEHFDLLFGTTRKWRDELPELRHVVFGSVLGDDKKPFKTRSGGTVGLESLIDEAIDRARKIVDTNDDAKPNGRELDDAQRAEIAEIVGLGGIKYADLKHKRESDYVFSWDKMLATTGDTATYIQYAFARICGILRKAGASLESDSSRGEEAGSIILGTPEERALALRLNQFAEAVDGAAADYRPNILTQYLFELATDFSGFYNACPVAKEQDVTLKASRLNLCRLTAKVLQTGLDLLGIETSETM